MDRAALSQFLAAYAHAWAALGRGETPAADVVDRFAVPFLLTTDDVVVTLQSTEEVEGWLRSQATSMAAAGYERTETVAEELTVLSSTTAVHRAALSRRGADDAEIARMTITYLVVRQPDGWRMAALLVHSAERTGPSPRGDGGAVGPT